MTQTFDLIVRGGLVIGAKDVKACLGQSLAAHCASRPATHDCNITHRKSSMKKGRAWSSTRRWEK